MATYYHTSTHVNENIEVKLQLTFVLIGKLDNI